MKKYLSQSKNYYLSLKDKFVLGTVGLLTVLSANAAAPDVSAYATDISDGKTAVGLILGALLAFAVFVLVYRKINSTAK